MSCKKFFIQFDEVWTPVHVFIIIGVPSDH